MTTTTTITDPVAATFRALKDPNRVRLLRIARRPATLLELTEALGITQPTVSHHLRVLLDARLITRDHDGMGAEYLTTRVASRLIAVAERGTRE